MEKSTLIGDALSCFDSVQRVVTGAAPVGGDTIRKMAERCGIQTVQQGLLRKLDIIVKVRVQNLLEFSSFYLYFKKISFIFVILSIRK